MVKTLTKIVALSLCFFSLIFSDFLYMGNNKILILHLVGLNICSNFFTLVNYSISRNTLKSYDANTFNNTNFFQENMHE